MKTTVKILIVILLILDAVLLGIVLGSFGQEKTPETIQATEAFAPAEETAAQPTQAAETVPETTPVTTPETTQPTVPPETFLLTFVGDCTLGSSPNTYYADLGFVKTVGDDLEYPFRNVHSYFEEDDFTMVNLEGVLAERGYPMPKAHTFRGPVKYAKILSQGSVEAVTLANNHTFDYGVKGYESTLAALEEENVPYVEGDSTIIVTTEKGLKVGIYAMTYADLDVESMEEGIAQLKQQGAELILVAAHWGVEGDYTPCDEQVEVGHAAIDAGAHIVYGSHPHVLQPIEEYAGGIIYYSLGNFAFGGNGAPKDLDTALIRQEILRSSDGTVTLGDCIPIPASVSSVEEINNFQPTPYETGSEEYQRVMSKLDGTYE